jgi:tetratricopeptide (TPR) repeat protein
MKCARAWPVLVALLGLVPAAQAQLVLVPSPYAAGYPAGGFAIGVGRAGRHGYLSGFVSGGGYYSSYYGYPLYPVGPTRITVVQVVSPPPVVVTAQPGADAAPARPQGELVEPPAEKAPPGDGGGFRPVRPPVPPPPKVPEVPPLNAPPKAKPKEPAPPEKPNEKPAAQPPRPPRPEADPRAESARQGVLGKAAFAAGEYGRAAQRFRQAIQVNPNDGLPYFLLAQAEVALGKYDQAVAAIQAGMRLERDWPAADFRPVRLYDANVTDWPEHLQALEDALARHPDDAVLLFLSAYELWFDGRRDEARILFQQAAAVAPDRSFSERFLLARPDQPAI